MSDRRGWLEDGYATGLVKIDRRHYLLRDGTLPRPSVRSSGRRLVTLTAVVLALAGVLYLASLVLFR